MYWQTVEVLFNKISSFEKRLAWFSSNWIPFVESGETNYKILNNLHDLRILDSPILVGLSRKSMIYKPLETSATNSLNGTTIAHSIAIKNGANILRVHDVLEAKECIKILNLAKNNL